MSNDESGSAQKIALGSLFPKADVTTAYDFSVYAKDNDSKIGYTVINNKTGNRVDGEVTTKLPLNTLFLNYRAYMNNGATAAAVTLGISRVYTETDF